MEKKSPLVIIFLTVFIDLLGFGIVMPVLPFYAEKYGATGWTVGLLLSSYSLMQLIFSPFWGGLSDRIGRRPVILISLFGSTVSYLIFGLADTLPILFISRLFAGLFGGNISASQAYISDSTTPQNRARGMGLIGAAFGLGFVLGPLFGGFFSTFGPRTAPLLASAICGTNFLVAIFRLPESRKPDSRPRGNALKMENIRAVFSNRRLALLILISFVVTACFSIMEATFALFSERKFGYTAVETGYIFGFVGIVMAAIQGGAIGFLARKLGENRLIVLGTALMIGGLFLIPLAGTIFLLLPVLVILAIGLAVNNPSLTSLISRYSDPARVGGTMGVNQAMSSLARVVGPGIGGFVFDTRGINAPYFTSAIILGIALVLSVILLNQPEPTGKQASSGDKRRSA
ncbi:MAG TPA: MFS transporter [Nitrospiria bacterium]|nr:MFS transporter [Nitrospiria bacterium]